MLSKFVYARLIYVITDYGKEYTGQCASHCLIVCERKLRLLSLKCDTRQYSSVDIECLKKAREHALHSAPQAPNNYWISNCSQHV